MANSALGGKVAKENKNSRGWGLGVLFITGLCKRKIKTAVLGILIYKRIIQKENKNRSPWGSYLQEDNAKEK